MTDTVSKYRLEPFSLSQKGTSKTLLIDVSNVTGIKSASFPNRTGTVGYSQSGNFMHLEDSTNYNIPNTTWTTVTFDTTVSDPGSNKSGNGYQCPFTGIYSVSCAFQFANNATGARQMRLEVDGADNTFLFLESRPGNAADVMTSSTLVSCSAGEVITIAVWQSSGGLLGTGTETTKKYIKVIPIP